MDKKKKILWIDDDVNNPALRCERDALEERDCIITPVTNPDNLQFETIPQFNCIIIDLFLPVGTTMLLTETQFGSRTGFVLLKKIIVQYPKSKIVVYSVFDVPEVMDYCTKHKIEYWNKFGIMPDEFAEKIVNFING